MLQKLILDFEMTGWTKNLVCTCSRNNNFFAMDKIFCPRQKVFVVGNIFLSETKFISSEKKDILSKQKAQAYVEIVQDKNFAKG